MSKISEDLSLITIFLSSLICNKLLCQFPGGTGFVSIATSSVFSGYTTFSNPSVLLLLIACNDLILIETLCQ